MDRLRSMEAFVRVVDAGSFSAAARSWGRSKAAVSKYVSGLEAHLGVMLLRRTTRSLSLTEAGRLYHGRCVDLLGELESLEASVHEDNVAPRGQLRVTAPPGFASVYWAMMTTDFCAIYPEVTMDLHMTHRMVDLVEEGFDVAIRVTEPQDSSLIARRLAAAPLKAVAAPSYLNAHGTPSRPEDLRHHDCLIDSNFRDRGRWHFEQEGERVVVEVSGPFQVNSPLLVRDLAIEGHGIALVPAFVIHDALDSGCLVSVLDGMLAFNWSVFAVYPQRRYLPGKVRAFIDHLAESLSKSPISLA